jgi:hypothetical protein
MCSGRSNRGTQRREEERGASNRRTAGSRPRGADRATVVLLLTATNVIDAQGEAYTHPGAQAAHPQPWACGPTPPHPIGWRTFILAHFYPVIVLSNSMFVYPAIHPYMPLGLFACGLIAV